MNDMINDLESTKTALTEAINAFTEEQFNAVPFEGSWTPAQVAEHIAKSSSADLLYGNTSATGRPYDQQVAPLKKIFLDFDHKMQSPQFIYPSTDKHSPEEMTGMMEPKFDQFIKAASTLDLKETCLDFEMPGMGHLTRFELITFFLVHTQRHIRQMNKIKERVGNKI